MPWVQFVLPIDVFERLVIRKEHKGLGFEVVTPMRLGPDYGIKFFVRSAVIALRNIEFLTEKGRGPLDWIRTAPIPTPLASHSTSNRSSKLGKAKTGA